jgi:hypothetical protein
MARLIFKADEVRRICEHSLANKQSDYMADFDAKTGKAITAQPDAPAILLVKDEGIYLMSNGKPRDLVSGDQESGRSFCAFAKGFHPDDEDCWDRTHEISGDDFGETLPWAKMILDDLDAGATEVVINFGVRGISFTPQKTGEIDYAAALKRRMKTHVVWTKADGKVYIAKVNRFSLSDMIERIKTKPETRDILNLMAFPKAVAIYKTACHAARAN